MKKQIIALILSATVIGMYSFGGVSAVFAEGEQTDPTNVSEAQLQAAGEQPQPEETISLSKTSLNLSGSTSSISATMKNAPEGSTVVWTSSDTGSVTVKADSTDSTKATLFAINNTADGAPATVTATISGTDISAVCTVTITGINTNLVSKWNEYAGKTVKASFYIHTSAKEDIKFDIASNSPQSSVHFIPGKQQIQADITLPAAYTSANDSGVYFNAGGAQLSGITLNSAVYENTTYDLTTKTGIQSLFNACGEKVEIKGSYVKWYVIKRHGDGFHVDGYVQAKCQLSYDAATTDTVTGLSDPSNVDLGEVVTVSSAVPVRDGYTFAGWENGDKTYNAGDKVTLNDNLTLYATWTKNPTYTLTYNANAGENTVTGLPTDTTGYKDGTTASVSDQKPIRSNYTFLYWSLTPNGEKVTSVSFNKANVTLYAQWAPVSGTAPTPGTTTDPTNPGTTVDPGTTTTPVTVVDPGNNSNTSEPTTPVVIPDTTTDPVTVVDPSDNSNTSESTTPVSTVKDNAENSNADQPKTGDQNDAAPWAVVLIAGAAMSAVILKKRTDK